MFRTPGPLDFVTVGREMLEVWEREQVFAQVVAKNRGGPRYAFTDGPITANNPMGVHHARGRTYKDVFQRYKAMRGFEQRFQNGFDCQGLWVEVEVEKALGLNSKREIEAMGDEAFARACRERVLHFAAMQTRQSRRLGQWMNWTNSYYTMADANITYIWHFL
ncbi:MAG: class I tRNA ligase family protein, partial [Candidatus Rokuibacteriota bacterium]